MTSYLDESTHCQMAEAIGILIKIIERMETDPILPRPTYEEKFAIRKAEDLRMAAIKQLRDSGVLAR